jgi:hypothetical protein
MGTRKGTKGEGWDENGSMVVSRRRMSYHGGGGIDAISAAGAMRVAGTSGMPGRVWRVGVGGRVSGGEGRSSLRVAEAMKQEGPASACQKWQARPTTARRRGRVPGLHVPGPTGPASFCCRP